LLLIFQNLLFNTMKKTLIHGLSLLLLGLLVASCGRKTERSSTTNWKYNDQKWGGFEKVDYEGQATGPNLVLIEGWYVYPWALPTRMSRTNGTTCRAG
jgi:hypothetical protein